MCKVSVIIPVFNGEKTLRRCLQAVTQQRVQPYEIIIADNGSTDNSMQIAQSFSESSSVSIRLIEVEKKGAAAARNAAVKVSKGDWLAFTDSDCLPQVDWVERGQSMADEDDNIVGFAGPAWGTLEGDTAAQLLGLSSLSVGLDEQVIYDAGDTGTKGFAAANLWVRKASFLRCKGFDESLSVSGEDLDLCARLYQEGGIKYHPKLVVRHIHASGLRNMIKKMIQYGQAHAFLFQKYGKKGAYFDLPILGIVRYNWHGYVWCNLASAEKKIVMIILFMFIELGVAILLPAYMIWIALGLRKRALSLEVKLGFIRAIWMSVLFVVKSLAMTLGRIQGSKGNVRLC